MGRWVNAKGWLKDYAPDNKTQAKQAAVQNFGEAVIFIRPRCPKCKSIKLVCYGIKGNIRYYKCLCGNKFKAIEKEG